jgi:hypothetical protein
MTEEVSTQKERTDKIFQIVEVPGERVWRQTIVGFQSHDQVVQGQNVPGVTRELSPNGIGQYTIRANDPHYDALMAAMKIKMEKENTKAFKRIIGPFDTPAKALEAMHVERPKTADERAQIAESIKANVVAENSDLKAKIAELESKIKSSQKDK